MSGRLKGKVIAVTGAGGGIGQAAVRRFIEEGSDVLCVDRDAESIRGLAAQFSEAGSGIRTLEVDVSTDQGNDALVAEAESHFGGLDVLFANAAVQVMGSIEATSEAEWQTLFRTNLHGVALGIKAALPAFRKRGGGSVIVTASLLGIVGDPDLPAYGAMKGGLRAMCRSLAAAHGPENVRFNTICPGDVDTPMLEEFFAHHVEPEVVRQTILSRYPLRRFATPADIANVAVFLASDDASYLTGVDIAVDGGLLAQIY